MGKPTLQVIIASTRPGRLGLPIGRWFADIASSHNGFDVELVDLAEIGLPFFDEPRHPRLGQYEHQHTREWSAVVSRADAFVFVTPEYNHGFPATLKNAIDFLHAEWLHKAVGFVSYGGVAAGTRSIQMLKPVLAAFKMVAVPEAVSIPFVSQHLGEDGSVLGTEAMRASAVAMLDELLRTASALGPLRRRQAA